MPLCSEMLLLGPYYIVGRSHLGWEQGISTNYRVRASAIRLKSSAAVTRDRRARGDVLDASIECRLVDNYLVHVAHCLVTSRPETLMRIPMKRNTD